MSFSFIMYDKVYHKQNIMYFTQHAQLILYFLLRKKITSFSKHLGVLFNLETRVCVFFVIHVCVTFYIILIIFIFADKVYHKQNIVYFTQHAQLILYFLLRKK